MKASRIQAVISKIPRLGLLLLLLLLSGPGSRHLRRAAAGLRRGCLAVVLAVGDGLLQLLELEPVHVADELQPDNLAGAAQHLDRLN